MSDESREAFTKATSEIPSCIFNKNPYYSLWQDDVAWSLWQAAVEWARQDERERLAKLAYSAEHQFQANSYTITLTGFMTGDEILKGEITS